MAMEENIKKLPLLTQGLILDEIYFDPEFADYIKPLLARPNPYKGIFLDMKKAMQNEFAPEKFPAMAGKWKILRARSKKPIKEALSKAGLSGLGVNILGFEVDLTQILTETVIPQAISHYTASIQQAAAKREQAKIDLLAAQALAKADAAGVPPPPPPPSAPPPPPPSVYYPGMRTEQQQASQSVMIGKYLPYVIAGGGSLIVLFLALSVMRR